MYKIGGPLPYDAPSYVSRQADQDLYDGLLAGKFFYVLNSRQMGKSSLRVQVMRRLQEKGVACAAIDITKIGSQGVTPEEWYAGLVLKLIQELKLSFTVRQFDDWWQEHQSLSPVNRFSEFIDQVLLREISSKIVIFIDEIDSILQLGFKDDFFAVIRACYNERADESNYDRLMFAFLGVATPSDLILDKSRTPFNIGHAIQLNGFQFDEARPLAQGLVDKAENPEAVLQSVLYWTGGQPFLTQKLCQLVLESDGFILKGREDAQVEQLVRTRVIENWRSQDEPVHLRTIRDRFLQDGEQRTGMLLELYQQIVQQGEIVADDRLRQVELQLTGLVVKQDGKLRVYNRIYQQVFDLEWIELVFSNLRPYSGEILAWLRSGERDESRLLRRKALRDARTWGQDKSLGKDDRRFLDASLEAERKKASRRLWMVMPIGATLGAALLLGGFIGYRKFAACPFEKGRPGEIVGDKGTCFRNLKTSGESGVFLSSTNFQLDRGIEAFKQKDYEKAKRLFKEATYGDRTDPVPQIFLNNTLAREREKSLGFKPLKLAVVTSVDYYESAAMSVLRGVADAQEKFNKDRENTQNPLMEIVVVNDENEPEAARKVAQELVSDHDILGVIGHHASESTSPAQEIYETVDMPIISATSSSSQLRGEQFFRIIGSTTKAAVKYADYIRKSLKSDEIVVLYKNGSNYSQTLTEEFNKEFSKQGGRILDNIEIGLDNFRMLEKIKEIVSKYKTKTALIISDVKTSSMSIAINRYNAELPIPTGQKLKLLGSLALSEHETLAKGGSAVEGVILARPCLSSSSEYVNKASERWGQTYTGDKGIPALDWRTAASYDATQAFAKAITLSKTVTREEILRQLRSPSFALKKEETSGFGLKWDLSGDRSNVYQKYCVVQVKNGRFEQIAQ